MKMSVVSKPDMGKKVNAIRNVPKGVFSDIAKNMLKRMRDRIAKGKDHKGGNFVDYATSTVDRKTEIGRDASVVNMNDRGVMIRGLNYTCSTNEAEIFLGARKNIGMYHQKGMGVPKREWFGYTKESAKKAREEFRKYIKRVL